MPPFAPEYQTAIERALMTGERDNFPFVLGLELGKSLAEIGALAHSEVIAWRAFYVYREAQRELAAKETRARRGR